ncbi:MAG: hypothetical protein LJE64_05815 [Desulfofustis sp.]|nr:hypothetical protein [Desulfofustis sp.]
MDIFLIDAIGPFFRGYTKQRINWSKIPFQHLKTDPDQRRPQFNQIARDMELFAKRVSAVGYNAVSLDDVAHLAPDEWLEAEINITIGIFQEEYRRLFSILQSYGLRVYLTMDILSFTPLLKSMIGTSLGRALQFLKRQLETIFTTFDAIDGIIFRIGECDGHDVRGDFKSELFLRNAAEVNRLIRELLPLFEIHNRTMILRTWTIGAYRIGDLVWHRDTTARVLRGIDSPRFILSMKYGESDFFRYLPLNNHFFTFKVRKIIELQARREYEGCGEFPSFVGWDYHQYAQQLKHAENMAGISVWCQTGGWVPFNRLSYLEPLAIWNELNSYVSLKLFKDGWSVEQAVASYCLEINCPDSGAMLELLKLDDSVIKELLYIKEVAQKKLFFRRVRIPSLLTVYWNNIFINHSSKIILLALVKNREETLREGEEALRKIKRMKEIARELNLPEEDFEYMEDTFKLLALARRFYFLPDSEEERAAIKKAKLRYKKRYPRSFRPRYRIKTNYTPAPLSMNQLRLLIRFAVRSKRGYRIVDYLFTLHLLGTCYRMLAWVHPSMIPKFARKQAMGIGTIFR